MKNVIKCGVFYFPLVAIPLEIEQKGGSWANFNPKLQFSIASAASTCMSTLHFNKKTFLQIFFLNVFLSNPYYTTSF